jgi:hypothetical protein
MCIICLLLVQNQKKLSSYVAIINLIQILEAVLLKMMEVIEMTMMKMMEVVEMMMMMLLLKKREMMMMEVVEMMMMMLIEVVEMTMRQPCQLPLTCSEFHDLAVEQSVFPLSFLSLNVKKKLHYWGVYYCCGDNE